MSVCFPVPILCRLHSVRKIVDVHHRTLASCLRKGDIEKGRFSEKKHKREDGWCGVDVQLDAQ